MKILVTGGGGYIGSVLVRLLLEKGYGVVCLDRFFFGKGSLGDVQNHKNLRIIRDDIRHFDPGLLDGVDAVMDLAALSGDGVGELNPNLTIDINSKGRARVAQLSKKHGVKRYILASSSTVYGFSGDVLNESSPVNPQTTYSKANLLAEQSVMPLADSNFNVTSLRQATVYGMSPRMRFDLAVNGMTLGFFKNGRVPVRRDGNQWRPFVHVADTSRAFVAALEADSELVNRQLFNVGGYDQNWQVLNLARNVAESIGVPFVHDWYGDPDPRSYRLSFEKIRNVLKFTPKYTVRDGAREVLAALKDGKTKGEDLRTNTVAWYKHLIEMHSILKEVEMNGSIL